MKKANSLVIIVALLVMMDIFQRDQGNTDFFQNHGFFFLGFIAAFPRLTLLFSSVATGGFIWWLGFFFCPRVLVASLATVTYFNTNPLLVWAAWIIAIGGEFMEKKGINGNRNRFVFKMGSMNNMGRGPEPEVHTTIKKDDAIEAEFTRKE